MIRCGFPPLFTRNGIPERTGAPSLIATGLPSCCVRRLYPDAQRHSAQSQPSWERSINASFAAANSGDSAETLRQAVMEAYEAQMEDLPTLEDVTVTLYPDAGPQRVAEIGLVWGEKNSENLETGLDNQQ